MRSAHSVGSKESRNRPRDGGPGIVYGISWFEDSTVCSVCMGVSLYPIVIFSDAIVSNSGGLLPK